MIRKSLAISDKRTFDSTFNVFKSYNDTIKYLVVNSLANYDIVMSELSKILLYYEKPCSIKMTDEILVTFLRKSSFS